MNLTCELCQKIDMYVDSMYILKKNELNFYQIIIYTALKKKK